MLQIGHVLPFFPEYRFAYERSSAASTARCWADISSGSFPTPLGCPAITIPQGSAGRCSTCTYTTPISSASCAACRDGADGGQRPRRSARTFQHAVRFRRSRTDRHRGLRGDCPAGPAVHARALKFISRRATLLFDFAAIAGGLDAHTPLTVLSDSGKATAAEARCGRSVRGLCGRVERSGSRVRAARASPILDARLACDAVCICRKETESAFEAPGGEGVISSQASVVKANANNP